ncbi:ABC transporter permease [Salinisphaera sp.]|uniref:ABC transporter permease n=1 Tax=Salinisphaera sp. TaxID=1914330 RepID=UPI002D76AB3F|nr:ABC transporter permease [Salinisphaera sp.]HET7314241.1 ABC transporter permease [Salinisphaera sp.]
MNTATPARQRTALPAWLFQGVTVSYILLVVLFAIAAAINPHYASWDNIRNLLQIGAFIGVIAVGQTLVIITGQIDLSVPWNLTFSAILMATLCSHGYSTATAVAAALASGTLVGMFNSIGTAIFRIHSLVWTLGVNALMQGATLVYTHAQPPRVDVPPIVRALGSGSLYGIPVPLLVWIAAGAVALVILHKTSFGRYLYAIGNNESALFLSGVDSRKVYLGAFATSGFCAALAGIMLTGYSSQTYLGMGSDYLLVPIAAVIIGGTNIMGGSGGYLGSISGALIVVLLQSVLSIVQIQEAGKDIVFGTIIILLLLLYGRQKLAAR